MRNIVIEVSYDGTKYSGFQRQGNTKNTIEDKLLGVIGRMCPDVIEIHGSGRTDAGVHARKQVVNFKTGSDLNTDDMIKGINDFLPEDIRVNRLYEADLRFHSRLNAKEKEYRYIIDSNLYRDVFIRRYSAHITEALDLDKMSAAAGIFIGEHDFRSFTDMKQKNKSTVRTVYDIDITSQDGIITIKYKGNGFLYHMVRIMTEYLIKCGKGIMKAEDLLGLLEKKERIKSDGLAPASGLILYDVKY